MPGTAASRLIVRTSDDVAPGPYGRVRLLPAVPAPAPKRQRRFTSAAYLLVVMSVAAALWTRGLGDESAVWIHADTPHYLMNGVFLTDLLRDLPMAAPMTYARQYFARYPGLSLGHHPLLTPILEVPFFAAKNVFKSTA